MSRTALVTGGNRGIGFAACRGLAKEGLKVWLGSRDEKNGREAAEKLRAEGLDVSHLAIDVSDPKSIASAAQQAGGVDVLINNAGVLPEESILKVSDDELHNGLAINLMGPINCIRAFVPAMIDNGYGRVVNVSSGWGSFAEGLGGPTVYSISKAALNAVTVKAAHDLPDSVLINSMCPGWVHTRMGGEGAPRSEEEGADTIIWLATLPDDGPSGEFFRDREAISW